MELSIRPREHVIYTQTFSKSFSPGLRVGFGILPRELVGPICDRKGNEDFGSANFNQRLIGRILETDAYARHVRAGARGVSSRSATRCWRRPTSSSPGFRG